jgi:chitin disaccharide deacetylase
MHGAFDTLRVPGFPPNCRLLIIHADDFGMCRSVNRAIIDALEEGTVSSASIMVPCPAFSEAAKWVAENPGYDIGVHSTLISEQQDYKWGPVATEHGPGMVDQEGHFWPSNHQLQASPEEVEREITVQIISARESGITPTHLDSHTFSIARPEYVDAYAKSGRRFGIPFLINKQFHFLCPAYGPETAEDVVIDELLMAGRKLAPGDLEDYYLSALRNVKAGLNQLIVHPGFDDAELRSITRERVAYGAAWRQRDFEIIRSLKFRSALKENGIHVIHWGTIKMAMEGSRNSVSEGAHL